MPRRVSPARTCSRDREEPKGPPPSHGSALPPVTCTIPLPNPDLPSCWTQRSLGATARGLVDPRRAAPSSGSFILY